jgi:hypothetical protein
MFNLVQFAEMDRRPWQPRQLAGENGSARPGEASSDSGEGFGERPVNTAVGAAKAGVGSDTLIDPARSASDVAFKPKCLGIHSSMSEYRFDADSRFKSEPSANLRSNHWSFVDYPRRWKPIRPPP